MTGPLALVGGAPFTAGCTFDAGLLAASGGTEVAVLPTGSAYEHPGRLVDAARTWLASMGADVLDVPVLTRADALDEANAAMVAGARFVYLAGTSPMHLRSVLKDTPTWDALVGAWEAGAVVAGANAGADVLCDPMVDSRGGAFTVGLGLVEGLAVIPRFNTWSHEKVHRTVQLAPRDLQLVGVPEATAVLRDPDGSWRAEGVGEVVVYVGGEASSLSSLSA